MRAVVQGHKRVLPADTGAVVLADSLLAADTVADSPAVAVLADNPHPAAEKAAGNLAVAEVLADSHLAEDKAVDNLAVVLADTPRLAVVADPEAGHS